MILLDTHALVWWLEDEPRLPAVVGDRIAAEGAGVSAITFYEIGQKVRLGKWPEMAPVLPGLRSRLEAGGVAILPVGGAVAERAATMAWDHRDPFDRIIAATALAEGLAVATEDAALRALPGLRTVW